MYPTIYLQDKLLKNMVWLEKIDKNSNANTKNENPTLNLLVKMLIVRK